MSKIEKHEGAKRQGLSGLERLRSFEGSPAAFWPAFLKILVELAEAESGVILIRSPDSAWKAVAAHPRTGHLLDELKNGGIDLAGLTQRASAEGAIVHPIESATGESSYLIVADVTPTASTTPAFAALGLAAVEPLVLQEAVTRVQLGREAASVYSLNRRLHRAEETVESFAAVLDLLRVMDARRRYLEAVMTLCNEVSARFRSERVSLGWLTKGDVRLQAISHTEKIEKKMGAVLRLEEVMEEALDQDEEIIVPAEAGEEGITRSHERFAKEQSVANIASYPLRLDDQPVAVLTLERASEAFEEAEQRSLRLLCDQVARRLSELKKHDRWIGARAWTSVREQSAKLVGVENTGWKLIGLSASVLLAILIFGGSMYRVEAPFILKTDTLAQIPAAYDGYIQDVHVRVGDRVEAGAPLVDLDQRELLLQEASSMAELRRHRSDAQRAEAEGELAQMRSAQALADQAEAKLEILRYRLSQAKMVAPFDGVVVEGDLEERVGAPAKQGEVLLKLARLDQLYVESKMHERNIHLLEEEREGQIAFASRPQEKFSIVVERIEPLAIPEEKGNVFIVRSRLPEKPSDWWRPGMSGLSKVETERRSYLWMLTRRTVNFLRMKFWW